MFTPKLQFLQQQHQHSSLHHRHHPPWLGMNSGIAPEVLTHPSVCVEFRLCALNWPLACKSLAYPVKARAVQQVCFPLMSLDIRALRQQLQVVGNILLVAPQTDPPPPKVYESPIRGDPYSLGLLYTSEGGAPPPPKVYKSLLKLCRTTRSYPSELLCALVV